MDYLVGILKSKNLFYFSLVDCHGTLLHRRNGIEKGEPNRLLHPENIFPHLCS